MALRSSWKVIGMNLVLVLFLGLLPMAEGEALSPFAQTTDDDWPMLAHDLKRSGRSSIEITPPYTIKWVRDFYSADNEVSEILFAEYQPIVVRGLVYVGTSRNNMYALDSDTGETVWKYSADDAGGEIMSSPAVSDGVLYFGSTDGYLYALDAQTGAFRWQADVDFGEFRSSPAVVDGKVLIGATNGTFYAFSTANGSVVWKYETDGPILNSPAVDAQRGVVYFGSEDMHAYALNLSNGSLVWRSSKLYGASMRHYYPVIAGDMVIFRTNPGNAWRALDGGDTLLGRTAGLNIPEDFTHLRADDVDIHAAPGSGDIEHEQAAIRSWLTSSAYPGHRTFYALDADTGADEFSAPVPVLWSQGAGSVGEPPVVTADGRVLLRWRSYYGDIDYGNPVYLFSAIGELNQSSGEIIPFNLVQENNYYSTAIFMIGDEPGIFSIGGDRLYIYSHGDSVGSVSLTSHEAAPVMLSRDIPWGVGHGDFFPGQRNLPFGPFGNDYRARFAVFAGGGSAPFETSVVIADGKLFWNAQGMVGAVEHGSDFNGKVSPPLDGAPVYPSTPAVNVPSPSDLEEYVLYVEEYNPDLMAVSDLRARLEAEVSDVISGEPYAPFFLLTGKGYGQFFFADPSEELYALSISLPYLSSGLQAQVKAYLAQRAAQYNPLTSQFPVDEGKRREHYRVVDTDNWQACQEYWDCKPRVPPLEERLYHLWAYAYYTGDWSLVENSWSTITSQVHANINPDDPASLLHSMYNDSINRRVSALIAYTRMAEYLGDQTEYVWGLGAATRGLQARISYEETNRPGYGEWIGEKEAGKFMSTTWGGGGKIVRYRDLVPEIGRALRDYAWGDMQNQDAFIETVAPAQYLAWSFAVGRTEQFTNFPSQAHEIFQAKALIMDGDTDTLRRYLSVPWCAGDLYYIEKLVLAIRASSVSSGKSVSPTVVEYGDTLIYNIAVAGTGTSVTVTDRIPAGTTYIPGSASCEPEIGILDAGLVGITWMGVLPEDTNLRITFSVEVATKEPTAIVNSALVQDGSQSQQFAAIAIANGYKVHLPLILKHH
ncbi:MAG: PQQ-binding-like beta-propeller repeat protein [Anaerolineae bacterium]|nr:PQQ-binding-like beta-propeller repeat protein [Anaerolineae bacterium]